MSIKLRVSEFSSTDVADLEGWVPLRREEVYFPLCIEVVQEGAKGGNLFQMVVGTPEGVRRFAEKYGRLPDRNLLVVLDYDWKAIEKRIRQIVDSCSGRTWQESIRRLERYFQWEYEE